MRSLRLVLVFLFLSLISPLLRASTLRLTWGLGAEDSKPSSLIKFGDVQKKTSYSLFETSYGGGFWLDRSRASGVKDSIYGDVMAGLGPRFKNVYIDYLVGPALISNTDSRLGSHFEVSHDAEIGLQDSRGVRFGFSYRHFSNGGLSKINEGRDLLGFAVGISLR